MIKRTWFCLPFLAAALVLPVMAQDAEEEVGRGVARISVIAGDVSVRRTDTGEWIAAAINVPLIVPDSIFAGEGSRAEVQLDWANMVRLAANTEVRFAELEENRYQLQIARGTITFSVIRDTEADVDLSTPNVSVRPYRKGRYRITVNEDGTTAVTVRSGEAEIYTPRGTEILKSGKTMLVRGTLSDPEYQIAGAIPKDSWDQWNANRDKELQRSTSYQYVSRDIYGAEDLDGYGQWINSPEYGMVWSPRVAPGWAPYRYGRWAWTDWYGWNWISYDPWGWAPYHYGRWFHYPSYGWCWYPGSRRARHYWSPGLVAFFGYGSGGFRFGFGIGVGIGHVGWVPLAPHEPYHRWYGGRHYRGYGNSTYIDNSVNIVNNVNIRNTYRNARVQNGVTGVEGGRFGRGAVRNTYTDGAGQQAHLVRGQLPVAPGRESVRYTDREVSTRGRPATGSRTDFYSRRQASNVERVSFADQQRGMQQVASRASRVSESTQATRGTRSGGTTETRATERTAAAGRTSNTTSRGGWRSVSETPSRGSNSSVVNNERSTGSTRTGMATRSSQQAGWRTFGEPSTNTGRSANAGRSPDTGRTASPATGRAGTSDTRNATRSTGASRTETPSRGGWSRFGETRSDTQSPAARRSGSSSVSPQRSERGSGTSGSRSIIGSRSSSQPGASATRSGGRSVDSSSATGSQRRSQPSYERSAPSSVRMSPSIVRQRSSSPQASRPESTGRSSGGSIFGGGNSGGSRSSGSVGRSSSRPSMGGSPRMSAPSGGGGGGSAGARSSGGGRTSSGGSRSGGGRSSRGNR